MNGNAALYVALRVAAFLLKWMPASVAHGAAHLAGTIAFYVAAGPRGAVLDNLSVVMARDRRDRALLHTARDVFRNDVKNWIDTLRITKTSGRDIEHAVSVDYFDRLKRAHAEGRGIVLVTMHLGNFDLVGQLLIARGYHLTVPVERMEPPRLFDYLVALRASKGINIVPLDRAPREMLRALRAGNVVGVAGDRIVGGRGGRVVRFFDRPTMLPYGPVSLARRTGAPLLIGVGIRRPDDTFDGHVVGPIPMEHTGDGEADDTTNLARLALEMERLIRAYPGQWLNFSAMWPSADSHTQADTMDYQTEARA